MNEMQMMRKMMNGDFDNAIDEFINNYNDNNFKFTPKDKLITEDFEMISGMAKGILFNCEFELKDGLVIIKEN